MTILVNQQEYVVARGKAYPWSANDRVHGMPMRDDHLRISMEVVAHGMGELEIPTPTDEHQRVIDVLGSSCQWPTPLVILDLHADRYEEVNVNHFFMSHNLKLFGSIKF
jgi:hypothetical protein